MPRKNQIPRWGQSRRLRLIDLRLQYDGRINRSDLIEFFDISTPQASTDLSLYAKLAPKNMRYDPSERVYVALGSFTSLFENMSATGYLDELQRLARGVVEPGDSFVGFVPQTGVVDTPVREIAASEVSIIVRAIEQQASLRVRYVSMDNPHAQMLVLSPHALGFDGLRWHTRAWCYGRQLFRDFAIGRMEVLGQIQSADRIDPSNDTGWNRKVPVRLVPHPNLSKDQREAVIRDYAMKKGQLVLSCRQAMLFYTLRHLNLGSLEVSDRPAGQHVIVQNADDVRRWVDEDREGIQFKESNPQRLTRAR